MAYIDGTESGEVIEGWVSEGDDIEGNGGDDTIYGYAGNDRLYGGNGNDALYGGDGNDIIDGGAGNDTLEGGAGFDQLRGGTGINIINGGTGVDFVTIDGAQSDYTRTDNPGGSVTFAKSGESHTISHAEVVEFRDSDDSLTYIFLAASPAATQFDDVYYGNDQGTTLFGLGGNDYIYGFGGSDELYGGDGDDWLDGGAGNDTLIGDAGNDTYFVDSAGDTVIEGGAGRGIDSVHVEGLASYTLGYGVENLFFSGDGSFAGTGNALENHVTGGRGNDTLDGGVGDDTISGGAGNNTINGGDGKDIAELEGGKADYSWTSITAATVTFTALANQNGEGTHALTKIEVLEFGDGSAMYVSGYSSGTTTGKDFLIGSDGGDSLVGGNGNDYLYGNGGNDTLYGDAGNDMLYGGDGSDTIYGGAGDDVIYLRDWIYNAAAATEIIDGGVGIDKVILEGYQSDYTIAISGGVITITRANKSASMTSINELLFLGDNSAIATEGTAGNDNLLGGDGDDTMYGLAGNDTLDGGAGADTLIGGTGNDTYVVDNAGDIITELPNQGTDTIQSSIDWSLAPADKGANVENLTLTGADIDGTGNALNNVINGSEGDNNLSGGGGTDTINGNGGNDHLDGGAGADKLLGGAGDDTYIVDLKASGTKVALEDTVTEGKDAGNDTIELRTPFNGATAVTTLTLGSHIENFDASATGATLLNLTGNTEINLLTGNDANNVLDGKVGVDSYIGGKGDDTYVLDNALELTNITELAGQGTDTLEIDYKNTSATDALIVSLVGNLSEIENVRIDGTGRFDISGNAHNNTLIGNASANVFAGGQGDDSYYIGTGDSVEEQAAAGTDTVYSSVNKYVLGANLENLTLAGSVAEGTGNADHNTLTGNAAANKLYGMGGNDTLYGMGGSDTLDGGIGNDILDGGTGSDKMIGGAGDDTYYVDATGDLITEDITGGTDTVLSTISYSLVGKNLENLTLLGTAAINATGNVGVNTLIGNAGNNVLDGGAGMDNDIMIGGLGDDTYIVDNLGDVVTEGAGEGKDTVYASLAYDLGVYAANVENLTLTGADSISASGSADDNILVGNAAINGLFGYDGNDVLDGKAGVDIYSGGDGDDTYVLDNALELANIAELANKGEDLIRIEYKNLSTTVAETITLNDNLSEVENVTIIGAGLFNITGNDLGNMLRGNDSANTLVGGGGVDWLNGGKGADRMEGGAGNDYYTVDNIGDQVIEIADLSDDSHYDTVSVLTIASYTLGADLENLQYSGSGSFTGNGNALNNMLTGGSGADKLYGGDGDDMLLGNAGNDTLNGGNGNDNLSGGVGNDTLVGGDGNDVLNGMAGKDTMAGGLGDDRYFVDNAGDKITEVEEAFDDAHFDSAYIGTLGVATTVGSYTLSAYVEKMIYYGNGIFTGTGNSAANEMKNFSLASGAKFNGAGGEDLLFGNQWADTLNGGDGNDQLSGNAGNDTLFGGNGNDLLIGGDGDDRMEGGAGDDQYYVSSSGDIVVESLNAGTDVIHLATLTSYVLSANVENLYFDTAGVGVTVTGNGLNNQLSGNTGADTLNGDAGNDSLFGNDGNDILNGGIGDDYLYGNANNDTLNGGAGNDQLDGGIGDDAMNGGLGNDVYFVDSAGDTVTEVSDTSDATHYDTVHVQGVASYTMTADVERLYNDASIDFTGLGNALDNWMLGGGVHDLLKGGGGNDILYGNDGFDELQGEAGNDTLYGGAGNDSLSGGAGSDTMYGGAGIDWFIFDTALNSASNVDTIADFVSGTDKIYLNNAIFTSLTAGASVAPYLIYDAGPFGDEDFLIYDDSTGALYYDGDGTGSDFDQFQIATLTGRPSLLASDFVVI